MDELARGFAEFLGEILAEQWLKEQQTKSSSAKPQPDGSSADDAAELAADVPRVDASAPK